MASKAQKNDKKITTFWGGKLEGDFYEIVKTPKRKAFQVITENTISLTATITIEDELLVLPKVIPWNISPAVKEKKKINVNEEEIFKTVRHYIKTYIEFPAEHYYDIAAVWVMSTWIWERFTTFPYLRFMGPKACGKSKAQDVLGKIAYRGYKTSSLKEAVLAREISERRVTVFVDEMEDHDLRKRDLYPILNAGYREGDYYARCEKEGDRYVVKHWNTSGFKVLASRRPYDDALESRCLTVKMRRCKEPKPQFIDQKMTDLTVVTLLEFRICQAQEGLLDIKLAEELIKDDSGFHVLYGRTRIEELLTELIYVLSRVSRVAHSRLEEEIEKLKARELEEDKMTDEAVITLAVEQFMKDVAWREYPSASMIAEIINRDITTRQDEVSAIFVGQIMTSLGFEGRRKGGKRFYEIDRKILDENLERFG